MSGYRLVAFSTRGSHKYVIGSSKVAGLDAKASVPPGEGTTFKTMPNARGHARRELGSISSYYRFELVNDAGNPVQVGMRTGFNGTGKRIVWEDVPYAVHVGKPSWHQERAGAISAGFTTWGNLADAEAHAAQVRESKPNEHVFVMRDRGRG